MGCGSGGGRGQANALQPAQGPAPPLRAPDAGICSRCCSGADGANINRGRSWGGKVQRPSVPCWSYVLQEKQLGTDTLSSRRCPFCRRKVACWFYVAILRCWRKVLARMLQEHGSRAATVMTARVPHPARLRKDRQKDDAAWRASGGQGRRSRGESHRGDKLRGLLL